MSRKQNIVYVGGLDESISEELLHAAFITFGDIKSVQVVRDFQANKSRGFGFVEFESEEDAEEAIGNMDGAELLGRVLRCNVAKMPTNKIQPGKAIWNTDEFYEEELQENDNDKMESE